MSNIIDGEHAGGCRDLNCVGCVEVSPVQGGYFDAGDWNKRVARAERDARVDLSLSAVDATCRAVRAEGVREGVQQAISKLRSGWKTLVWRGSMSDVMTDVIGLIESEDVGEAVAQKKETDMANEREVPSYTGDSEEVPKVEELADQLVSAHRALGRERDDLRARLRQLEQQRDALEIEKSADKAQLRALEDKVNLKLPPSFSELLEHVLRLEQGRQTSAEQIAEIEADRRALKERVEALTQQQAASHHAVMTQMSVYVADKEALTKARHDLLVLEREGPEMWRAEGFIQALDAAIRACEIHKGTPGVDGNVKLENLISHLRLHLKGHNDRTLKLVPTSSKVRFRDEVLGEAITVLSAEERAVRESEADGSAQWKLGVLDGIKGSRIRIERMLSTRLPLRTPWE